RVRLCRTYATRTWEVFRLLHKNMKHRFRLYRRKGGVYYIHDSHSGKQASLGTRDRREETELFSARLQAHRQAHLNLQLARTYLTATDPMVARRTWQDVNKYVHEPQRWQNTRPL